jgi:hypothetical protein
VDALNVSGLAWKKHPAWIKLLFADSETIESLFHWETGQKNPGHGGPGREKVGRTVSA